MTASKKSIKMYNRGSMNSKLKFITSIIIIGGIVYIINLFFFSDLFCKWNIDGANI